MVADCEITSVMLDGLHNLLNERPDLYLDELVDFLWNEFDVCVSTLQSARHFNLGWLKKAS